MKNDFREFFDLDYIVHSMEDVLAHHGIKGMHWGERNGPPYPLDSSISTGKSLKIGEKSGKKTSEPKEEHGYITAGMVYLASYIAAYAALFGITATVAGVKNAKAKKLEKKIKKDISTCETDPETKLPKKNREYTEKEDLAYVNPGYNRFDNNDSTRNCVRCTMTYELRKRGYNVTAAKTIAGCNGEEFAQKLFSAKKQTYVDGYGKIKTDLSDVTDSKEWNDRKLAATSGKAKAYEPTVAALSKQNNARGQMLVTWASGYSGHSFIYEVKNGKVKFLDAQNGKAYTEQAAKELFGSVLYVGYQRLDNCKTINKSLLKEVVNEYRG